MRAPRILLPIDFGSEFGYQIVVGIAQYAQSRDVEPAFLHCSMRNVTDMVQRTGADGVICSLRDGPAVDEAAALAEHMPVINVAGLMPRSPVIDVLGDDRAAGRVAARHLLNRGLRRFAYFGMSNVHYSDARRDGFVEAISQAGGSVRIAADEGIHALHDWSHDLAELADWLDALARPAGIFAVGDWLAQQVLEAARYADQHVPDDLAVLGVGNELTVCELTSPTLSSIDNNNEKRGYEAAAMMMRLLDGEPPPEDVVHIGPRGVVERESTNLFAVDDADVVAALRFIRDNAGEPITVEDVLDQVPLSRRTLENRFRAAIGRSPHEEIWRCHIERACRLLLDTDLSLLEVALRSGFRSASAFSTIFRRRLGMTPKQYRRNGEAVEENARTGG